MRKKVLFILNLPPPVHGSAVMGELIQNSNLIKENIKPHFINLTTASNLSDIGKGSITKLWVILKLYLTVIKNLISQKFDLCYLTINSRGRGFYKDYPIVLILKLFGCKILYHFHNKGVSETENSWFHNLLYRIQFKNTKVIILSHLLYYDIERYINKDNVYICPNGIPVIPGIDIDSLQKRRSNNVIPNILFLSNMMKEKGVFTLLEASNNLVKKGVKFRVQFVGDWKDINQTDFLEFVIKNKLEDFIFFEGPKYGVEKVKYFEDADIFIFPSFNETFGLVNLEAMQFGLPIIASRVGGIPDIISHNETGFLIEKKNHLELSNKIQYLIENPEISRKMGKAGRNKFCNEFKMENFESTFQEIIENLLHKY